MALIKTAVELALEKTQGLKADKTGAERDEAHRAGRILASRYVDEPEGADLEAGLSGFKAPLDAAAREGAAEAFLARVQLPRDRAAAPVPDAVGRGLAAIAQGPGADKRAAAIVKDMASFLDRYLEDVSRVEEGLKRQYAPKLRQKEEELARRTGQDVRIDPRRDPEYLALLGKAMGQVKAQYQDALDRAKEELKALVLG